MSDDYYFDVVSSYGNPSILHPLEPKNIGESTIESLAGYIVRLARAHHISTKNLMVNIIHPAVDQEKSWADSAYATIPLHPGSRTEKWTNVLNQLTGGQKLERCTLVWMQDVIAPQKLISKSQRYCPQCVISCADNGIELFDQLMWRIELVLACPLHKVRLRTATCGAAPAAKSAGLNRRSSAGHCRQCGIKAYRCDTSASEEATKSEVWAASQIADLIKHGASGGILNKNDFIKGMKKVADDICQGYLVRLAKKCGLPKSQTWRWVNDTNSTISLTALLQICSAVHCSLLSLLTGNPTYEPKTDFVRYCNQTHSPLQLKHVEALLRSELKKDAETAALANIAKKLGVTTRSLRDTFPELAARVVKKSTHDRLAAKKLARQRDEEECANLCRLLLEKNLTLTLNNAAKIVGKKWTKNSRMGTIFLRQRMDILDGKM